MTQSYIGKKTVQITEEKVCGVNLISYKIDSVYPEEEERIRPAIIILPGGAYSHKSKREGEPVALYFLSLGYHAFILDYTVGRDEIEKNPPEREVAFAIRHIRERSGKYKIDPEKIVLLGFSAGGHLALSSTVHYKEERANYLVLCYPVVTMGEWGHEKSTYNLTGGDEEKKSYYSIEKAITKDFPPSFIWHTSQDKSVSVMNTIMLTEALAKNEVDFEYHVFQKGGHGMSVCTNEVKSFNKRNQVWLSLLSSWLEDNLSWEN